jgi:hypothetical protein
MSIDDFHLAIEPCVDEIIGLTPRATAALLDVFDEKSAMCGERHRPHHTTSI